MLINNFFAETSNFSLMPETETLPENNQSDSKVKDFASFLDGFCCPFLPPQKPVQILQSPEITSDETPTVAGISTESNLTIKIDGYGKLAENSLDLPINNNSISNPPVPKFLDISGNTPTQTARNLIKANDLQQFELRPETNSTMPKNSEIIEYLPFDSISENQIKPFEMTVLSDIKVDLPQNSQTVLPSLFDESGNLKFEISDFKSNPEEPLPPQIANTNPPTENLSDITADISSFLDQNTSNNKFVSNNFQKNQPESASLLTKVETTEQTNQTNFVYPEIQSTEYPPVAVKTSFPPVPQPTLDNTIFSNNYENQTFVINQMRPNPEPVNNTENLPTNPVPNFFNLTGLYSPNRRSDLPFYSGKSENKITTPPIFSKAERQNDGKTNAGLTPQLVSENTNQFLDTPLPHKPQTVLPTEINWDSELNLLLAAEVQTDLEQPTGNDNNLFPTTTKLTVSPNPEIETKLPDYPDQSPPIIFKEERNSPPIPIRQPPIKEERNPNPIRTSMPFNLYSRKERGFTPPTTNRQTVVEANFVPSLSKPETNTEFPTTNYYLSNQFSAPETIKNYTLETSLEQLHLEQQFQSLQPLTNEIKPKTMTEENVLRTVLPELIYNQNQKPNTDSLQVTSTPNQTVIETPLTPENLLHPLLVMAESAAKNLNGHRSIKLKLYPEELGTVEIRLETDSNGALQAHLITETAEAKQVLSENLPQLHQQLQHAGWQVERLDVAYQPNSFSSAFSGQNSGSSHSNPENSHNFQSSNVSPVNEIDGDDSTNPTSLLAKLVSMRA